MTNVRYEIDGHIAVVTIDRPARRNAVDAVTAAELIDAFKLFDADDSLRVAVLSGANGVFCAGADLQALAGQDLSDVDIHGDGPLGPTRMLLSKPVIAAVEGYAVAGGLELALWCDLRVAASNAVFGVFCRRWGVPLIDGGTVRLPRLIGHSHAMDMILTGRGVSGDEAVRMGLVNRSVEPGAALVNALDLAKQIATFPQECLRNDRLSACQQWSLDLEAALANEAVVNQPSIESPEIVAGLQRFADGAGRHGSFAESE